MTQTEIRTCPVATAVADAGVVEYVEGLATCYVDLDLHHERAAAVLDALAGEHHTALVDAAGRSYDVRRGARGFLAVGPGPAVVKATAAELVETLRQR